MTDQDQINRTGRRMRPRMWMFPVFFLLGALLFGAAVMLLWNAVLPDIAPVKPLNYGQALGLLALCRILFGGRFSPRPRGSFRRREGAPFGQDKWMNMSAEERDQFKEEWKKRCGRD